MMNCFEQTRLSAFQLLQSKLWRLKSFSSRKLKPCPNCFNELQNAADALKEAAWNSIALSAGTACRLAHKLSIIHEILAVLTRYAATTMQTSSEKTFDMYKQDLGREARAFVKVCTSSPLLVSSVIEAELEILRQEDHIRSFDFHS